MPFFVDVILPLPIPKLFTYLVNEDEYDFIQPGIRIVVPFGNTKKYAALRHRTHQNTPPYESKSIEYIIDEKPVVSSRQLELWEWISHYYMSPLGSVFRTAVPSILLLESETELHFHNTPSDGIKLSTGAAQLLNALEKYGKLNLSDVVKFELSKSPYKIAQELFNHNLIHVREEVYTKFKPKQQKQLALASSYKYEGALQGLLVETERYPKQRETLLQLMQQQTMRHVEQLRT